jgi:hypothetical protein
MEMLDYQSLAADDAYRVELGQGVWLMDNHKWALWIWESHALKSGIEKFTLAHADHHWDGGYHPYESPKMDAEVKAADLTRLEELLVEDVWIRYDSFIAPAVVRGKFDEVHFFCRQDDGSDKGIGEELLQQSGAAQVLHGTVETFTALQPKKPLIFDLCLDLFNNELKMMDEGDVWPDAEILGFLQAVRPLIEGASLVTVSLSFGYSGTEDDTRHLAELVIPNIMAWRAARSEALGR